MSYFYCILHYSLEQINIYQALFQHPKVPIVQIQQRLKHDRLEHIRQYVLRTEPEHF